MSMHMVRSMQSGFLLWKPICVLAFITVRVLLVICLFGKSLLLKCLYFCEMFTCEMLTFVKCLLVYTCEMLLLEMFTGVLVKILLVTRLLL